MSAVATFYDPLAVLKDLCAALESAGVPATVDGRDVNPPGVLVELESIAHNILCGQYTLRARLLLCVPDLGTPGSLSAAGALLEQVLGVVTPNTETDTTYETVALPSAGPVPALVLRVDLNTTT